MKKSAEVVVVGLGAMGSAALAALARRGASVIGLDRFAPPHTMGSSHGGSRIIRQAYYEGEIYVPMLLEAYPLWRALEEETGTSLFLRTGGLMIGPEGSSVLKGSIRSAEAYRLPHEILTAEQVSRRFPAFSLRPNELALFEPQAGMLRPEAGISAHMKEAQANGANIITNETIDQIVMGSAGVTVRTGKLSISADRIVLAAGAWSSGLMPDGWTLPMEPHRVTVHWFAPENSPRHYCPPRFPVFIREGKDGTETYGLPPFSGEKPEVKHGFHNRNQDLVNPDHADRRVHKHEVKPISERTASWFRGLSPQPVRSEVCFYSVTPDRHFILGAHPEHDRMIIAAGFSGHGYKFAPVVGNILASLALREPAGFSIDAFAPGRFS